MSYRVDELQPTTVREQQLATYSEGGTSFVKGCNKMCSTDIELSAIHLKIEHTGNQAYLCKSIQMGTALIVTDGSFLEAHQTGAAAWILTTPYGKAAVEGTLIAPGLPFQQNAYCSELLGVLASLDHLQYYIKKIV